ncbi:MAG: STAS/SEC14 domain-containing protein [Bacteroidota bacterium]
MIEPISTGRDDIVGFRTDSTTSTADMKPWLMELHQKLQQHPKLRLLIEYVDDHGFSLDTLVEDFRYNFGKRGVFEKAVIITCSDWLDQAEQLAHQLRETQLKSFHYSEQDRAIHWIKQS